MSARPFFTAARTAMRANGAMKTANRSFSVGSGPHASSDGLTKLKPEVYPLLVICALATSGGTYMMLNKLFGDQDLRLHPTRVGDPLHETINYEKEKFGPQAGGHTYKDSQGWTRIAVNDRKA